MTSRDDPEGSAFDRRTLIKGGLGFAAAMSMDSTSSAAKEAADSLTWQPAWRIREMIGAKKVTPTEVTEHFLARIAKLEPTLHAFETLDAAGAREQAAAATRAVQSGATLGPLHGIPVSIMTGGAKGFKNPAFGAAAARYDTIYTERLRKAGAIIVGTATTYYWDDQHRPRNPWDITRDPGNSCRGSAIAVSAGMVPIAIAGDGAGSTRLPAAWCGCIGLATTRGLVPHIDYEKKSVWITANMGPMARDARDAAIALQVIAGRDGRDFLAVQSDVPDYSAHIDDGVKDMSIAWTDDFGWSKVYWLPESAEIVDIVKNAAFGLSRSGAKVTQINDVWDPPAPASQVLERYNSSINPGVSGGENGRLEEIDRVWGAPQLKAPSPVAPTWPKGIDPVEEHRYAAESRASMVDTLERVLQKHQVLISATCVLEPKSLREWGLGGRGFTGTSYSAHTRMLNLIGYPAISVPCGMRNGLPVGMQIIGRQGREDVLLRVAMAVQKAYPISHPPIAV